MTGARAGAALAAALLLSGAGEAPRRSGFDDMSPALQAMQREAAQNPGQLWVREGQTLWQRPGANGKRCTDCHADASMDGVAARYPVVDAAADGAGVLTLPGRIDRCRVRHQGQAAQAADGDEVLALSAWLAERSKGMPITPAPGLDAARERGRALWQQRLGQLNLSCAQCHDERAGARLGGAVIPQAHPSAYPVYRLEWQGLGSLERRLRGCLVGVRAEPFGVGAGEWAALEAWLMQRSAGMPYEGVGVRP